MLHAIATMHATPGPLAADIATALRGHAGDDHRPPGLRDLGGPPGPLLKIDDRSDGPAASTSRDRGGAPYDFGTGTALVTEARRGDLGVSYRALTWPFSAVLP
jgi:hypothetical protein